MLNQFQASLIGEGVALRTPSSVPGSNGLTPSWNIDGTFAGWVAATSPAGSGSELQYRSSSSAFGAVTGSSYDGTSATLPKLIISGFTSAQIGGVITGPSTPSVDMWQWNPSGVTAGTRARVTSAGQFSNNYGFSESEAFGAGAVVTGSAGGTTLVGNGAVNNSADSATIIGRQASAFSSGSFGSIAIGSAAATRGIYSIAIGQGAGTNGNDGAIAIGQAAVPSFAVGYGISFGREASHKAANQFVCGSSSYPLNNVYFGKGVSNATPTAWTLHGTDAASGDINGGDVRVVGGALSGSGTAGNVILCHDGSAARGNLGVGTASPVTLAGTTYAHVVGPSSGNGLAVVRLQGSLNSNISAAYLSFGNTDGSGNYRETGYVGQGGNGQTTLYASSGRDLNLYGGGVNSLSIASTGHVIFPTDNTYDIGASGATRPRSGYFGTNLTAADTVISTPGRFWSGTASTLDFRTSGTQRMNLDPTSGWRVTPAAGGFGVNDYAPSGVALYSVSTTEQLRLGHDASNYASFTVSSAGSLTVAPTGTTITLSSGVSVGAVTFAVLNATTATATLGIYRITDRANKLAYPDGTNWRFVGDDAIIS